jgi:hypothetical protein
MAKSSKHQSRHTNLTRKQLREYSFDLARLYLPKELEDYLLVVYNEEDFLDTEGQIQNYSEEDIWFGVRRSVMEYAQIKRQMDDLLAASDYLGNCALTIKVQNKVSDFRRWSDIPQPLATVNRNGDDIPA